MSQLSVRIVERLASLSSRPYMPFIFKVNEQLRGQNEKAYEPEILAVGPYHRGKVKLEIMEEHKLWYLKEFLERKSQSVDSYVIAMEHLEKQARECYAEPIKLKKDEFVEMMLLDGCFIIELFHKIGYPNLVDAHDPIFKIENIFNSIRRDLLLFENQIPLSILQLFVPLNILVPLALNFFRKTITNFPPSQISNNQPTEIPTDNDYHLLGLVHDTWYFSIDEKRTSLGIDTNHGFIKGVTEVLRSAIEFKKCRKSSSSQDIDHENVSSQRIDTNHELIKSVTELREAGIKFKKTECSSLLNIDLQNVSSHGIDTNHESIKSVAEHREAGNKFKKTEYSSLVDIKFENGIMKIPSLLVDDDTEWLFRNLIAYEQYNGGIGNNYMTDYMTFMDCLISSPKDVEILRHSEIIDNWLGDDEVVSTMFNKMGNHVHVNPREFYYGKMFKEVNKHCKHLRYGWLAFLRYNYCNSPWSILSVIVASVFLLLTVIQTGCSILQV